MPDSLFNEPVIRRELVVRRATPNDLTAIAAIWLDGQAEASNGNVDIDVADVEAFYVPYVGDAATNFGIWIAEMPQENGSELIGWQALLPCRTRPFHSHRWALSSTYVKRGHRNRGVGNALLSFVTGSLPALGFTHAMGYIRSDNSNSIRMYESLGWSRAGTVPGQSDEGELGIYFYVVE